MNDSNLETASAILSNELTVDLLNKKLELLERKLELCKRQRNQYIDTVIWEFHCGPNTFEDEIKKTIDDDDKVIEDLK